MGRRKILPRRLDQWILSITIAVFGYGCDRDFPKPEGPGLVTGNLQLDTVPASPASQARARLVECGLSIASDGTGYFRFNEVPSGEYTLRIDLVEATIEGESQYSLQLANPVIVIGPALTDLGTISLTQSGWVQGTVVVDDGSSPLNTVVYPIQGDVLTTVADSGHFTLLGVPAGTWKIGAAKPGYMLNAPQEVYVEAGQAAIAELTLVKIEEGAKGSIEGMVILGNPGPEAGVAIALTERFQSTVYSTVTNAHGSFRLANIPMGYYELLASHPNYRSVGISNLEIRKDQELVVPMLTLVPSSWENPQNPTDGDPSGNLDDDGDGINDRLDNCPVVPNPDQVDCNDNGIGDACEVNGSGESCDPDDDHDGILDAWDNCPKVYNPTQENHDDDPLGDACDRDADDDGYICEPFCLEGSCTNAQCPDSCPLIPNLDNDPEICNWDLVYSKQDEDSGFIDLYYFRMRPTLQGGFEEDRLTHLSGQAWGTQVVGDGGGVFWAYFHYHPSQPNSRFQICRVDVTPWVLGEKGVAWNGQNDDHNRCFSLWSEDVMNPTLCRLTTVPGRLFLFYERFETNHWNLAYLVFPDTGSPAGLTGKLLDLFSLHYAPKGRSNSFRYPACRDFGGRVMEFGYSVNFFENLDLPNSALNWNSWTVTMSWDDINQQFVLPQIGGAIAIGSSTETTNTRRPEPGGDMDGQGLYQPGWFVDVDSSAFTPIYFYSNIARGSAVNAVLTLGNATDVAYLPSDVQNRRGLLAYQSDITGSADVFVKSWLSGVTLQLTFSPSWAGSPAWVPRQ